ncbi:MAG: flagellar motor switch protein FliN [Dethiobacteria bacterium]|jgi:flagellar motor switch protein FliN/FliY|nr:flagellar motor switch protein FliN [Bacillota bacterium]
MEKRGTQARQRHVAQRVNFMPLKPSRPQRTIKNKTYFSKIPFTLSAELGTAKITLRDLLNMEKGTVIKLDKPADETVNVLINDLKLARGEVVVINDYFGVRITSSVETDPPSRG